MFLKVNKKIEFVVKYFFLKYFFECGFELGVNMIYEVNMLYIGLKKSMFFGKENENKYWFCIGKVLF